MTGPLRVFLLALLMVPALSAAGQSAAEGSLEWYDSRAKTAISESNYESAVKILSEAKLKFPLSPKINLELADLYYDKELTALALDEYRAAEKKGSVDFRTLNQIARSFGKLNRDKESIDYLTRILRLFPESMETVDDLGWMYFKTFQLEKGEKLLLDGIKKNGMQRDLAMTLGTIYSGMNRYEPARKYYLSSIDDALKAGDRYFASIAYYNLSLLEHNFFHFNSALAFTEDSISMQDRASGHLARGELYQSRMDYRGAMAEFEKAFQQDTTPLTRVNMANLNQHFGRLELARRNAEEALATTDLAWMLYYGTDSSRHYKDIHEILADVYGGLAVTEATRPTAGFFDWVSAQLSSLRDRLISWYHRLRFRLYSLEIGKKYVDEGRWEEAYWEFYKANEPYREVASSYLAKTRAMEIQRSPHAEFYYLQEEGRLIGSVDLLEKSLAGMDPFWEKEGIAETLAPMIPLLGSKSAAGRDALNRLYDINPGAFRQNGFGLPLRISVTENAWGATEKGRIFRYLGRAGSELSESEAMGESFRFTLRLSLLRDGKARYTLTDARTGRVVVEGNRELKGNRAAMCSGLAQAILDDLYKIQ
jgi:tetratricopeptide (TPR) repeat protein